MIIYWAIILLEGMMLHSCLHCRSWLRLDLLITLNPAREFCYYVLLHFSALSFLCHLCFYGVQLAFVFTLIRNIGSSFLLINFHNQLFCTIIILNLLSKCFQ
jgi:hypothetical protein